ncbi:hypothetical protein Nmel_008637 [Mimus melanotis]
MATVLPVDVDTDEPWQLRGCWGAPQHSGGTRGTSEDMRGGREP